MISISLLSLCLDHRNNNIVCTLNSFFKDQKSLLITLSTGLLFAFNSLAFGASASLSWDANTESDLSGYKVYYGTSSGSYGSPITLGNTTSHSISGLGDSTYYFSVTAYDTSGNESAFSIEASKTFSSGSGSGSDATAPVITNTSIQSITGNTATITWTTDEPATSQVFFGLTNTYGSSSIENQTLETSHSHVLTGLTEGTDYHFSVSSADVSSNTSTSNDDTFSTSTLESVDSTPPADVTLFIASGEDRQMVLTWINPSDSDFVGVRLRFRADRFPSDLNDGALLSDIVGDPAQNMRIVHSGLAEGTTYYYLAATYDASGNFQTTAFVSGTTKLTQTNTDSSSSGGGGCGMIRPGGGEPPKPGDAAGMVTLIGFMFLLFLKKTLGRRTLPTLRI